MLAGSGLGVEGSVSWSWLAEIYSAWKAAGEGTVLLHVYMVFMCYARLARQ